MPKIKGKESWRGYKSTRIEIERTLRIKGKESERNPGEVTKVPALKLKGLYV